MLSEGYLRRHIQMLRSDREHALLDVAQEYILEDLRRKGIFDLVVFKGGTALRKFIFGVEGRLSVDLDFALRDPDPGVADLVFDALREASFSDVRVQIEGLKNATADLTVETPRGITTLARVSVRRQLPWLPIQLRDPKPFLPLDQGLEFQRSPLPIIDLREIAAEKLAAFSRRRHARDLYDLEHLGRLLVPRVNFADIAELAALKIYFDVVEERLPHPIDAIANLFDENRSIAGVEDLGLLRASTTDPKALLVKCASRYSALGAMDDELVKLVANPSRRDLPPVMRRRGNVVARLTSSTG